MGGRMSRVASGKLLVLIITNFVDMVGLLMIIPLMPFYARDLGGGALDGRDSHECRSPPRSCSARRCGAGSPIDTAGALRCSSVSLLQAIAYVVFAFANSIWLLLLSRIVQGAGGGTVGVIQAYVADSVEPDNRAKALGWLSAATNVGVAIGPAIGGAALAFGRSGPGLAAAALCLVNIVFAWRFLPESRDMTEVHDKKPRASRTVIAHVFSHAGEPAPRLIWIYAIAMGAFSGLMAILALFLADQFGVGKDQIWIFYTYIGVISVVTRAGILGRMVDRFGEARLSRIGLVLLATGLAALPLARGLRPARDRGGADPARDRVHVSVRDVDAVARDLEQRARPVHGSAANVRWIGARDRSALGWFFLRPSWQRCAVFHFGVTRVRDDHARRWDR